MRRTKNKTEKEKEHHGTSTRPDVERFLRLKASCTGCYWNNQFDRAGNFVIPPRDSRVITNLHSFRKRRRMQLNLCNK